MQGRRRGRPGARCDASAKPTHLVLRRERASCAPSAAKRCRAVSSVAPTLQVQYRREVGGPLSSPSSFFARRSITGFPRRNTKIVRVSETLLLHADLGSLAGLVGTWRGGGRGEYPTIDTFAYEEETRFWHAGAAFLYYHLRSWSPKSGAHLHSELGFWRAGAGGRVDVTLAHPLGLTEVAEGTVSGWPNRARVGQRGANTRGCGARRGIDVATRSSGMSSSTRSRWRRTRCRWSSTSSAGWSAPMMEAGPDNL